MWAWLPYVAIAVWTAAMGAWVLFAGEPPRERGRAQEPSPDARILIDLATLH